MGATFHQPEGAKSALLCYKNGKLQLSPIGNILRDIYKWHKDSKGERGESYTPILFLVDYNHGHTGRRWQGPETDFHTWQHLPFDDGDYMHEHFVRTVDKFIDFGTNSVPIPPYSPNIVNSKIGDICDIFFANPPQQGGAVKKEHLDKYPIVILLGKINYNEILVKRLKGYVKNGGTLMINAAQCKGTLLNDAEFLGLEVVDGENKSESIRWQELIPLKDVEGWKKGTYEIVPVKLKGAKAVKNASESKLPLVTKYRYGKGNVIVTTPYFMLLKNKEVANPLIEELLVDLQREVLPIQVQGDIQFLMNKITPTHWKVVLINNKGILKHPESPEVHIRKYAADVLLTAPAGVTAEEILNGNTLNVSTRGGKTDIGIRVLPGEVKVIDIKGLEMPQTLEQEKTGNRTVIFGMLLKQLLKTLCVTVANS